MFLERQDMDPHCFPKNMIGRRQLATNHRYNE